MAGDASSPSVQRVFHVADYVVFVVMLLMSLLIGIYFSIKSRKESTTDQYLLGNRRLGILPVAMSFCVSFISTTLLLGGPAEACYHGATFELAFISLFLAQATVIFGFIPMFYPLNLLAVHKYLELRYGSKLVRLVGTFLQLTCQLVYMGCVIFGPATALETAAGIPVWGSILIVGIIGTTYTSVGGIKAVIWTDVFQAIVMLAGLFAIVIQGCILCGGISEVWIQNRDAGRLVILQGNILTDRISAVSIVLGYYFFFLGLFGVNQPAVQRFCAMETMKRAQLSLVIGIPFQVMFKALVWLAGMVAFAYYNMKGCDPLAGGYITNPNQIAPYMAMEILAYPGVPGLFISSLFCASLSNLSSSINGMSAVIWDDILFDRFKHLSEEKKTWVTKALSVLFGILCTCMAFIVTAVKGNLLQINFSFFGCAMGPLLGLFVLGALVPWANWLGALIATFSGLALVFLELVMQVQNQSHLDPLPTRIDGCLNMNLTSTSWTALHQAPFVNYTDFTGNTTGSTIEDTHWIFRISFIWNTTIGFCLVMVLGMILSVFTSCLNKKHKYPRNLLCWGIQKCLVYERKDAKTEYTVQAHNEVEKTSLM